MGIPGWDKVGKLAIALLALNGQFGHVTNKQANEVKKLYLDLDEYDKKAIVFSPKFKKSQRNQQGMLALRQWQGTKITCNQT